METLETVLISAIVTIVVALIAASPGLIALKKQKKKDTIDVAVAYEALAGRQAGRIDELNRKIDELEARVDALQKELMEKDKLIDRWSAGIDLLISQIVAGDSVPVWRPKKASG